jgi:hypothetical protein
VSVHQQFGSTRAEPEGRVSVTPYLPAPSRAARRRASRRRASRRAALCSTWPASPFQPPSMCRRGALRSRRTALTGWWKGGGVDGVCGAVGAGTDPDNECALDAPSTCGQTGACGGAGACALFPAGTVCAAPSCSGTTQDLGSVCDGAGVCVDGGVGACAPGYQCVGDACATSCADDASCAPGYSCDVMLQKCSPSGAGGSGGGGGGSNAGGAGGEADTGAGGGVGGNASGSSGADASGSGGTDEGPPASGDDGGCGCRVVGGPVSGGSGRHPPQRSRSCSRRCLRAVFAERRSRSTSWRWRERPE